MNSPHKRANPLIDPSLKRNHSVNTKCPLEQDRAVEKLSVHRSHLRQLPTALDSRARVTSNRVQTVDRRLTAGRQRTNTFSTPFIRGTTQHNRWRREDLAGSKRKLSTLRPPAISTTAKYF